MISTKKKIIKKKKKKSEPAVLADRVDLGGRQQLQRVRDQVRSRRAQHLEGQVDFQFSVNNKRKTNNERKQRVDHDYLTASNL